MPVKLNGSVDMVYGECLAVNITVDRSMTALAVGQKGRHP
jgi:hypothetical protein